MRSAAAIIAEARPSLKPPPRLRLSEWADEKFYLSAESAAEPGRWRTLPYQREWMDAFTDTRIDQISVMKSARVGYALDIETPIPTPSGWATMATIRVGDEVFDERGAVCRVTYKSPVHSGHPCFKIHFCDGSDIIADAAHQWRVEAPNSFEYLLGERGQGRIGRPKPGQSATFAGELTTEQIAQVHGHRGRSCFAVRNAAALDTCSAVLPIPPYTLGIWLGDGHLVTPRITLHRPDADETATYIREEGIRTAVRYIDPRYPDNATIFLDLNAAGKRSLLAPVFRNAGLTRAKHVPALYLRASWTQRLALLRGLMDSDGTIGKNGRAEFTNTNGLLARQMYELVISLGMKASIRERPPQRDGVLQQWRVNFKPTPAMNPFRIRRKASRVLATAKPTITHRRRIVSVERVPSVPVQCISVDSESSLYLAGHQMVPTHNTKILNAAIGYHVEHDPCAILLVQPTEDDAKGYSKEEIEPMLRDCPDVGARVLVAKNGMESLLHRRFRGGGLLHLAGARSPGNFRRVSRRVVLGDEVDGYPSSAGKEGDPIELAKRRTEHFWNRKWVWGSTPTIAGASRIEQLFLDGDQRRYYVPCPHCDFRQVLQWPHFSWPKGKPELAIYVCLECGAAIEHAQKRAMVAAGEWRQGPHPQFPDVPAPAPFHGHASFHIWAAYSFSPNATWGQLCTEFVAANRAGAESLKTFVNTVLGETWLDRGEAPEWERLYQRRAAYAIGTCPPDVRFLTAGVDVQKDRLVYEVVGWGRDKRSWSIDAGVLPGDTSDLQSGPWTQLEALLARTYPHAGGGPLSIGMMAVDSGYNTQTVYTWCKPHPLNRVIAVKGHDAATALIGSPSPVEITIAGRKLKRGYKVWPIATKVAKSELYGWLGLTTPTDEDLAAGVTYPPGYCGFPQYGEDYFKQLTGEQLVRRKDPRGFTSFVWELIPGRENHYLDARVYARAAAAVVGLDRFRESDWLRLERGLTQTPAPSTADEPAGPDTPPAPAPPRKPKWIPPRQGSWLKGGR